MSRMNTCKKLQIIIGSCLGVSVLSFVISYCLWAFICADFDYVNWKWFIRLGMIVCFIILSGLSCTGLFAYWDSYTDILDLDRD